jgi:hypothetical protein
MHGPVTSVARFDWKAFNRTTVPKTIRERLTWGKSE